MKSPIPIGKGKDASNDKVHESSFEEDVVVGNHIKNFDREDCFDVLGSACDNVNVLFKLFKWLFHEMNRTNVHIRSIACKVEDPLIKSQIDILMVGLNTIANTMVEELLI